MFFSNVFAGNIIGRKIVEGIAYKISKSPRQRSRRSNLCDITNTT